MNTRAWPFLLILFLTAALMACQPEEDAPPSATAGPATLPATQPPVVTPPPKSTPTPLASPEPGGTVTTVDPAELLACQSDMPQAEPVGGGPLQLLYGSRMPDGLWHIALWDEASAAVVELGTSLASPIEALSANGAWVAYALPNAEGDIDIGLRPTNGRAPERIVTTIPAWPEPPPEGTAGAELQLEWLPNSDFIAYYWRPEYTALGALFQPAVNVVDTNSGIGHLVLPEGTANAFAYRPDGLQIAALTDSELWLINSVNGQLAHQIPVTVNNVNDQSLAYSPDGRLVAVFVVDGVTLIDSGRGDARHIPLDYQPLGLGETRLMPTIHWPDNSGFFTMLAGPDYALLDAGAIFDVYWIDAQSATALLAGQFEGFLPAADMAEGGQHLAFWQQETGGNQRQLFLGETASGVQAPYDSGRLIEFLGWHPDRRHFTYWFFDDKQVLLGSLCEPPRPLGELGLSYLLRPLQWADGLRLVYVSGQTSSGQVGPDTEDSWTIRLLTWDGQDSAVATVEGTLPLIRVIRPSTADLPAPEPTP